VYCTNCGRQKSNIDPGVTCSKCRDKREWVASKAVFIKSRLVARYCIMCGQPLKKRYSVKHAPCKEKVSWNALYR